MAYAIRALVSDCLAGNQQSMLELVEQFRGQVFGLCFRLLGHRQDAEDVTQETFARALRSLAQWDSNRDFTPWLLAIAGNRCRTSLSARRRRMQTSSLIHQLPDPAPDENSARELAEEVDLALDRLRAEYRQAFVLFHEHELSYAEIAAALGCPVGTVKTWVHRARRELIQWLRSRQAVGAVRA